MKIPRRTDRNLLEFVSPSVRDDWISVAEVLIQLSIWNRPVNSSSDDWPARDSPSRISVRSVSTPFQDERNESQRPRPSRSVSYPRRHLEKAIVRFTLLLQREDLENDAAVFEKVQPVLNRTNFVEEKRNRSKNFLTWSTCGIVTMRVCFTLPQTEPRQTTFVSVASNSLKTL